MQKLVNGKSVDMTAEEIAEREAEEIAEANKDKRPIANGTDLVKLIEGYFIVKPEGMTDREHWTSRKNLQALFNQLGIKGTLESLTCNPYLKLVDFQNVLLDLDTIADQLTIEQITLFKNLLVEFMNNHRFFDYKPETMQKMAKKLKG